MTEGRTSSELFAGVLVALSFVGAVIAFFYRPLVFAPAGMLALLISIMITPRYRTLVGASVVVLSVSFVVGASIAAATDRALY
jgi:hypothetical protein